MKKIKKDLYKILTIVGTRPEIIKLSQLIPKLDKYFDHKFLYTGQNYDFNLSKIFFKDLDLRKPDIFLNVRSNEPEEVISKIISKSSVFIKKFKPDAVLIYGDTNSCLSAISAKKNKIPIFHMEAGNRSFDDRVPEEINRRIIDHISDINIVLSEQARRNLLREGIKPDTIFKSGSHMFEVIKNNINKINNSSILKKLRLNKKEYFVISIHREENVDNKHKLSKILELMKTLAKNYPKKNFIFSTHPRTKKRLNEFGISKLKNFNFLKPFSFSDYCNLQINSYCCISDSGTIFEESSILNFPAASLRNSHERQEAIDSGAVIMFDENVKNISNLIKLAVENNNIINFTDDYKNENVSSKIIKIIYGYISSTNSKVWFK